MPYSYAPYGSRSAPVYDDFLPFQFTLKSENPPSLIPGVVLIAHQKIEDGDEIFCNYRFSPFKVKPSWADFVLPSTEWDIYEEMCRYVKISSVNVEKRPENVDMRWKEEVNLVMGVNSWHLQHTRLP